MPALIASESPSAERASTALAVQVVDYTARTIYHSPETRLVITGNIFLARQFRPAVDFQ